MSDEMKKIQKCKNCEKDIYYYKQRWVHALTGKAICLGLNSPFVLWAKPVNKICAIETVQNMYLKNPSKGIFD